MERSGLTSNDTELAGRSAAVEGTRTLVEQNITSPPLPIEALHRTTHGRSQSEDIVLPPLSLRKLLFSKRPVERSLLGSSSTPGTQHANPRVGGGKQANTSEGGGIIRLTDQALEHDESWEEREVRVNAAWEKVLVSLFIFRFIMKLYS